MKILCFADLHAHNHAQFSTRLANGLNSRLVDSLNIVEQAKGFCQQRQIKVCVFLGDLFHSRTKIDIEVFSETYKAFYALAAELDKLYLVVGNHDQCSRVGDLHSLEPFRQFATVVDQPWCEENSWERGLRIKLFPFTADDETLRGHLSRIHATTDVVFLHQPVVEAIPGPADSPSKPKLSVDDIAWQHVRKVISGDIHKRQDLAGGRFHYVGSPLQLNFGERDEAKAFSILDTETLEIETVETVAPKFYLFTAAENDPDPSNGMLEPSGADLSRDFVKLRYDAYWEKAALGMKETYPRLMIEQIREGPAQLQRVSEEVVGNDRALLQAWIETNPHGDLDPDRLLEEGLAELAGDQQ